MTRSKMSWSMVLLVAVPTFVSANAAPAHKRGRLVGEPNGLESVAIQRERLSFDLRPLSSGGPALVEAEYEVENTGEERTVDLVFVSGPMASDSASVMLDDQAIPAAWKKVDALPPEWQAPDSTPAIGGEGTLPYEARTTLELPHFSIVLTPGVHRLGVRYSAKPTSYSTGTSPLLYWQLVYVLAPAREWAGFGNLDVQVQLPKGWRFDSSLRLTRSGDQLTGSFSGLPADAVAMTAQAPPSLLLRVTFWLSKLLLLACVVGVPLCLVWIGRMVGRWRAHQKRSVLLGLMVSLMCGFAWFVALVFCLFMAFGADSSVVAESQRSHNYGNIYMLLPFLLLGVLAFPAGLIITYASALAARRSVSGMCR